jgi:hypothetical protein
MTKRPKPQKVTPTSSDDLCKRLVAMAAFSLYDDPKGQKLVYEAVRKLQMLDAAARAAGILPPQTDGETGKGDGK